MIACAETAASRTRGSLTRLWRIGAILLILCLSAPAAAEVGATLSVFSDARFRGYSLSEAHPAAMLDFAYDDPSGLYAGASAIVELRRIGDPQAVGLQLDAGYADRLTSGTTLDVGIVHSSYSHYSGREHGLSYTEIYAGIARGPLSSRLYFSPHYFESGVWTAYGEINDNLSPARNWTLDGHVGVLVPLRKASLDRSYRTDFDWRIGVTRELGRLSLHAAWSDGAPGHDYYGYRLHSRSALVLGASLLL